jgi:hypothetical protein
MISDGEMVWTKVVFKKIYNFIFDYFFHSKSFRAQKLWFKINNLKIIFLWISQMISDGKTIKSEVIDLYEI